MRHLTSLIAAFLVGASLALPAVADPAPAVQGWIATWAASPQVAEPDPEEPLASLDGQTVRQRVRISIGGGQMRVRLSNEFGTAPLLIGAATIALAGDAAGVEPASLRQLTFSGRQTVQIPAGAPIVSDPVVLSVKPGAEVSISLYFPERPATATLHSLALKQAVVSAKGDFTREARIQPAATSTSSIAVTAVMVPKRSQRLIVALGDSITDGAGSTLDADKGWSGQFARRLRRADPDLAIVNAGIAGNQLAHEGYGASALARFDRDVLSLPGVTHVVLFEGINDLAAPGVKIDGRYFADPGEVRTADQVIAAYRQLIARGHDRGVKMIGATLTPFEGNLMPAFYSAAKERARQAVNTWIRTSGAFDGYIDFDAIVRDPAHAAQLQPRYASRDRLHPNDTGYAAMANAIDVRLFR